HPLRDRQLAAQRHAAVAALIGEGDGRRLGDVRAALKGIADVDRITARVALRSARPRDLSALRDALAALPALQAAIGESDSELLAGVRADIARPDGAFELLTRAIDVEPAAMVRDGG